MNLFTVWLSFKRSADVCVDIAAGTRLHAVRLAFALHPSAVSASPREVKP
jgi:hypothetical protein